MRLAILSDTDGTPIALDAVLSDNIEAHGGVDGYWVPWRGVLGALRARLHRHEHLHVAQRDLAVDQRADRRLKAGLGEQPQPHLTAE